MARGKTKGAGSFVKVKWGTLQRVLKDDAIIVVSRRFAEQLSLETEDFVANTENIVATPVDPSQNLRLLRLTKKTGKNYYTIMPTTKKKSGSMAWSDKKKQNAS